MRDSTHSAQAKGGQTRSERLDPGRRSRLAKVAAAARWKLDRQPTSRMTLTLTDADRDRLEVLRQRTGAASAGAVIRKLIRDAERRG